MRAASHATRLMLRNASLMGGLGASRITTWSTLAASVFSLHWSERKSRLRRVPTRSMEPCAEPVRRTSTKSPQGASWRLPLRVQTIWRRSANSTRNSRPQSATSRASMTTCSDFSRRACTPRLLDLEQRVELRGADEIVLRQAVDGVRGVRHAALVVADGEVRVMVLAMRNPGGRVHEGHGLVVVLEGVGLGDRLAVERPAVQALQQR